LALYRPDTHTQIKGLQQKAFFNAFKNSQGEFWKKSTIFAQKTVRCKPIHVAVCTTLPQASYYKAADSRAIP
jgi:hypothetical protein